MAEKKKAKPKAKAKPAEPITDKPELKVMSPEFEGKLLHIEPELEDAINEPAAPMSLQYSASDLAAMARAAKAGKADMQDVIAEHDLYLSLVKLGAHAPSADVDFVKNHLKYLKTL